MEVSTGKHAETTNWVNEYSDALYAFTIQRVSNKHISKDIVQETFLAAWKNYDAYKREVSAKNWLFIILKSKIADHFRKTARKFTEELTVNHTEDPFFDAADHWAKGYYPKEWDINYNSHIETKEFYTALNTCRSRLKEIQRAVFFMKYVDGLNSGHICKVLNLSPSNYWVVMHRAKVQLRACLEMNWFTS